MREVLILNAIWAQGKKYFDRLFAWLKYYIYHLISILAPKYKQHILSPANVRKVCYVIH
jgi:hypothetical protein